MHTYIHMCIRSSVHKNILQFQWNLATYATYWAWNLYQLRELGELRQMYEWVAWGCCVIAEWPRIGRMSARMLIQLHHTSHTIWTKSLTSCLCIVHMCLFYFHFASSRCARYCDHCLYIFLSVCRCVCLSFCLSTCMSQKPHDQISWNLWYMLSVTVPWCSSGNSAICYILVDDIMFSHNGASGPESKTTHISSSLSHGGTSRCQTALCLVNFTRWQHWSRVAVYDCRLVCDF